MTRRQYIMAQKRMKERRTELRLRHFARTISELAVFAGFVMLCYGGLAVFAEFIPYAEAAVFGMIGAGTAILGAVSLDFISAWRVK